MLGKTFCGIFGFEGGRLGVIVLAHRFQKNDALGTFSEDPVDKANNDRNLSGTYNPRLLGCSEMYKEANPTSLAPNSDHLKGYLSLRSLLQKLLHLLQTNRRSHPRKTDQIPYPLMLSGYITTHVKTRNTSLECFIRFVIFFTLLYAPYCVFHISLMFIFHADGILALSFILRAVFADNVAAEYFDFGDEVRGVRGVAEHCVDEVFFVTVKQPVS